MSATPDNRNDGAGLEAGKKILNRYTLKRILGHGGMGVVWLAYDDVLQQEVALKLLPDLLARDRAAIEGLKREASICRQLTHPHIVRVYNFEQDELYAGISMEYIAGDSLANFLLEQPTKCFEAKHILSWILQACEALKYAHDGVTLQIPGETGQATKKVKKVVVHRDLKPANLMIDEELNLKITDFGIARSISESATRSALPSGSGLGTLAYMSPQQAAGAATLPSDDIYSLGATIYELLTSTPPFFRGDLQYQMHEIVPPPMTERRRELGLSGTIPPAWEEVVQACLSKDPAKRPADVQVLRDWLEGVPAAQRGARTIAAAPEKPAAPPASKPERSASTYQPLPKPQLGLKKTALSPTANSQAETQKATAPEPPKEAQKPGTSTNATQRHTPSISEAKKTLPLPSTQTKPIPPKPAGPGAPKPAGGETPSVLDALFQIAKTPEDQETDAAKPKAKAVESSAGPKASLAATPIKPARNTLPIPAQGLQTPPAATAAPAPPAAQTPAAPPVATPKPTAPKPAAAAPAAASERKAPKPTEAAPVAPKSPPSSPVAPLPPGDGATSDKARVEKEPEAKRSISSMEEGKSPKKTPAQKPFTRQTEVPVEPASETEPARKPPLRGFLITFAAVFLLSATVFAVWHFFLRSPASVKISTNPPEATVTIDGQPQTWTTPAEIKSLSAAQHRFAITKPGYHEVTTNFTVDLKTAAGRDLGVIPLTRKTVRVALANLPQTDLRFTMQLAEGGKSSDQEPVNISVGTNGQETVGPLKTGTYKLRIQRPDFQPTEMDWELGYPADNQSPTIDGNTLPWKEARGELALLGAASTEFSLTPELPGGSRQIEAINGTLANLHTNFTLRAGTYVLRLRRVGFKERSETVAVELNKTRTLDATSPAAWVRTEGRLFMKPPANCELRLEMLAAATGGPVDEPPITEPNLNQAEYSKTLKTGRYLVTIKRSGFADTREEFEIREGMPSTLGIAPFTRLKAGMVLSCTPGADVVVKMEAETAAWTNQAAADGMVYFTNLWAGACQVKASRTGYYTGVTNLTLDAAAANKHSLPLTHRTGGLRIPGPFPATFSLRMKEDEAGELNGQLVLRTNAAEAPLLLAGLKTGTYEVFVTSTDCDTNRVLAEVLADRTNDLAQAILTKRPVILSPPLKTNLLEGQDFLFQAQVTGAAAIWWQLGDRNLHPSNPAILEIRSVSTTNAGSYLLYASNKAGVVTARLVDLTVALAAPTVSFLTNRIMLGEGETLVLAPRLGGSRQGRAIQWQFAETPMPAETGETLKIAKASAQHKGKYTITVQNEVGQASDTCEVFVCAAPRQPTIAQMATNYLGKNVELAVLDPQPEVDFVWLKEGMDTGLKGARLVVPGDDRTSYSVRAQNACGKIETSLPLRLRARPLPEIVLYNVKTKEPRSIFELQPGDTLQLKARAKDGSSDFLVRSFTDLWDKNQATTEGDTLSYKSAREDLDRIVRHNVKVLTDLGELSATYTLHVYESTSSANVATNIVVAESDPFELKSLIKGKKPNSIVWYHRPSESQARQPVVTNETVLDLETKETAAVLAVRSAQPNQAGVYQFIGYLEVKPETPIVTSQAFSVTVNAHYHGSLDIPMKWQINPAMTDGYFYMALTNCTGKQYVEVMGKTPGVEANDNPALGIELKAAQDFCEKLTASPKEQNALKSALKSTGWRYDINPAPGKSETTNGLWLILRK
jgi:serine/threonine protein kinase